MSTLIGRCHMAGQSFPSPKILYPEWPDKFQAALLEGEPKNLLHKIKEAEMAIFDRIKALSLSSCDEAERKATENAAWNVAALKKRNHPVSQGGEARVEVGP